MATYKFLILFENVNDTNKTTITRQIGILSNKYKHKNIRIKKLADNAYIVECSINQRSQNVIKAIIGKLFDECKKFHVGNLLVCEIGECLIKKPFS